MNRCTAIFVGILPLIGLSIQGTASMNAAWQKSQETRREGQRIYRAYHRKLVRTAPGAATRFVAARLAEAHPSGKKEPRPQPSFGGGMSMSELSYNEWKVSGTVSLVSHGKKVMLEWNITQYFDRASDEWRPIDVQGVYY